MMLGWKDGLQLPTGTFATLLYLKQRDIRVIQPRILDGLAGYSTIVPGLFLPQAI